MSWELGHDKGDSVNLAHDRGIIIHATKGIEHEDITKWQVVVTKDGGIVSRNVHEIANEEQLWSVLDEYAERYPE